MHGYISHFKSSNANKTKFLMSLPKACDSSVHRMFTMNVKKQEEQREKRKRKLSVYLYSWTYLRASENTGMK